MDIRLQELFTALSVDNEYHFYAPILFKCKVTEEKGSGTCGVGYFNNSLQFLYDPEFLFSLSRQDQIAVIRHEMLHIIYLHFRRIGNRDSKLHNIAADITINNDIFKTLSSNSEIVKFGISSKTFNYPENLTSEEYYDLLINDPEAQEKCKDFLEDLMCSDEMTDIDAEIIKAEVQSICKQAKDKSRGKIPAEAIRALDILFEPAKVDWREALKDLTGNRKIFKSSTIKRPNKRFQKRHEIPGVIKRNGFTVVCVVDVSGSMSDEEISKGLNEIKEICEITSSGMYLIQVDSECSEPEEFEQYQNKFERKRTGGTYLVPALELLQESDLEYDAIIIITDGETGQEPEWSSADVPVMVLCTTEKCGMQIGDSMQVFNI